jgi:hypothetical protein
MRNLASPSSSLFSSLLSSVSALALVSLAAAGCWDFEALQANSPTTKPDGGDVPMACAVPNGLQEDCTDPNADVNGDCLKGCQDPLCKYHTACLSGYKSAGNIAPNMMACTSAVPIYQDLQQQDPCAGCACNGDCTATLRYGNDAAGCTNMVMMSNVSVRTNRCTAFNNGMNTSQYRLSPLTAVCTPAQAQITLSPQWGTTNYLCENSTARTEQLADLLNNNQCIVFDGNVECPDFRDRSGIGFTTKQVFYGSASGSSQCACSCTPPGGSCAIPAAGDVRLTDQMNCGNTMNVTNLAADNMCRASTAGMMMTAYTARALQISNAVALPNCTRGGTPSGQFAPATPLTFCCK